jgi:4-alpha-glucanotransferase
MVKKNVCKKRGSGVLLHITSLPSPYGIGDLGPGARRFVDFLERAKQSYWQILPINPTISVCGHSPYSSISAFAGNTLLISPELLLQEGFIGKKDIASSGEFTSGACDYEAAVRLKEKIHHRAYERFKAGSSHKDDFQNFCRENSQWLDDYALFNSLRDNYNEKVWSTWTVALRDWQPQALGQAKKELQFEIEKEKFLQFLFFKQWFGLRKYCNDRGVSLVGDMPIYVNYDSADVWANSNIFKLDVNKQPTHVAGVPPDYFSATGQLWGNPVYRWEKLKELNYQWWLDRMAHNLKCFDYVRIDHFRGLVAYWEVKYGETTAINGQWRKVPVKDFFNALFRYFPDLPVIAEDLGIITDDVRKALKSLGFPGMKVLHFAFGEDDPGHPYLPHNFIENCLVYTGTHDNNTTRGWFEQDIGHEAKDRIFKYLGKHFTKEEASFVLIRLAMASVAGVAVFPMQDVLNLDASARMNVPSTAHGNWWWRVTDEQLSSAPVALLSEMAHIYGRA